MVFPFNMAIPSRLKDRAVSSVNQPQTIEQKEQILSQLSPTRRGLTIARQKQERQRDISGYEKGVAEINELFPQYEQQRAEYGTALDVWSAEGIRAKEREEFLQSSEAVKSKVKGLSDKYTKITGMKSGSYSQLLSDLSAEQQQYTGYEFGGREQALTQQFESLSPQERYAYGDPRVVSYIDMDRKRKYLEDTGERYTGTIQGKSFDNEVVYNVQGVGKFIGKPYVDYTESDSGQDQRLSGYFVQNGAIYTYSPYSKDGNRRLKLTEVSSQYSPSSKVNIPVVLSNLSPRGSPPAFEYQFVPQSSPNLKPEYFGRYPQLIAGAKIKSASEPVQVTIYNPTTKKSFNVSQPYVTGSRTGNDFKTSTWYRNQSSQMREEFRNENKGIGQRQKNINRSNKRETVEQAFNKIFTDVKYRGESYSLGKASNKKRLKGLNALGILKFKP